MTCTRYYPVPTPANKALYAKYQAMAAKEPQVTFVGRLANYKYFNMDETVKNALELFDADVAAAAATADATADTSAGAGAGAGAGADAKTANVVVAAERTSYYSFDV